LIDTSPRKRGSLTIAGTGIKLIDQITCEAIETMRRADKLLYVVTNPPTELWIRRLNSSAESLSHLYAVGKPRGATYREMVESILGPVRAGLNVCAVFYGHPGVFVSPSHAAISRARREGFSARMLPGISAEDCLFADLGVNPSEQGCQSFEATDFLGARRRFDPTSSLILWQVGLLGEPSVRRDMACRVERLSVLTDSLRRFYPSRHQVVLYEASQYPTCFPIIKNVRLEQLPRQKILPTMTLYVAPLRRQRPWDRRVLRWLDEDCETQSCAGASPRRTRRRPA
jgi:hypothetical protein